MSLRFRFLIAVNATLIAALALFLVLDYRFQRSTHLTELATDTRREASLLAQAVNHIETDNQPALHSLLARTTQVLRSEGTTRRDFAVLVANNNIITPSNSPLTTEQVGSLLGDAGGDGSEAVGRWLIGQADDDGRRIYVFRDAAEARAISAEHALWRLWEIGLVGLLATALINLLFIRLVIRPFSALATTLRRIGAGELGATTGTFRSREFQALAAEINQMSQTLAQAERERGLQMAKAGRLQRRLQGEGVQVPGLRVVHWHHAADHVAGDYFDLLRGPDDSWLICIADVTGHGVSAAMGAAILKTLLWSAVESGSELSRILQHVNHRFSSVTLEEDFASLLLIRWSPANGMLQYASAGHETAYLISDCGQASTMGSTGTLIGLADESAWEVHELSIEPGDRLILYTDGITEARSPSGRLFGRERLRQLIEAQAQGPIEVAIEALAQTLQSHLAGRPAEDDLTLVGLEFDASSSDHITLGPSVSNTRE
ncbi:MAG: SpoIIE family protein phosphatase [Thiohalocapsa sp.]